MRDDIINPPYPSPLRGREWTEKDILKKILFEMRNMVIRFDEIIILLKNKGSKNDNQ